jgi:hypothetical protein
VSNYQILVTDRSQPFPVGSSNDVISRVNPLDDENWDSKLAAIPSASFFQGTAWARVLSETYGFTPVYFTNSTVGPGRSILPVMEVFSPLTGKRGISLPFTDECAPSSSDCDTFRALFQEASDFGRAREWGYLECRGIREVMGDTQASTSFFGHQLELHDDPATHFSKFSSSTRRAVRKADQSGLTIEFSESEEAMQVFYDLLRRTRKRHGLPPQPFSFFSNIRSHILAKNQGTIVIAKRGNVCTAAAIFFHFGRTALFKFAASDESYHQLRVNNFVMWNAIKWHAHRGFEMMDFGRTSLFNEGLRKFKLGWGTHERPIDYFKYDFAKGAFVTARDESSGWYNRVFRMMPKSLSKLAGTALYKHAA